MHLFVHFFLFSFLFLGLRAWYKKYMDRYYSVIQSIQSIIQSIIRLYLMTQALVSFCRLFQPAIARMPSLANTSTPGLDKVSPRIELHGQYPSFFIHSSHYLNIKHTIHTRRSCTPNEYGRSCPQKVWTCNKSSNDKRFLFPNQDKWNVKTFSFLWYYTFGGLNYWTYYANM